MQIEIANQQSLLPIDEEALRAVVTQILSDADRTEGRLSLAVVDDPTIHELNRQYLQHDYATDVLSFALEDDGPLLEGEVIVSSETAITNATEYGWPAENELLLYVIHGTLHLVGYSDKSDPETLDMRAAEAKYLRQCSIPLPAANSSVVSLNSQGGT